MIECVVHYLSHKISTQLRLCSGLQRSRRRIMPVKRPPYLRALLMTSWNLLWNLRDMRLSGKWSACGFMGTRQHSRCARPRLWISPGIMLTTMPLCYPDPDQISKIIGRKDFYLHFIINVFCSFKMINSVQNNSLLRHTFEFLFRKVKQLVTFLHSNIPDSEMNMQIFFRVEHVWGGIPEWHVSRGQTKETQVYR